MTLKTVATVGVKGLNDLRLQRLVIYLFLALCRNAVTPISCDLRVYVL